MYKIVQVQNKSQLLKFVKFKVKLYKNSPYCVPPLTADEMQILNPKRNPAFEFSEAAQFLCYNGETIVGRICAFINHRANEVWNQKHGRFGWFDFIEDIEVAKLLLATASQWLHEHEMEAIVGPLGFTDLDHEGMLVEGFDQLGTMSTLYNFPYYEKFMQQMGFIPDAQWVEYKVTVPAYDNDTRYTKMANIVANRNKLHMLKIKNSRQLITEGWAEQFFELINISYTPLYGFVALSTQQKTHYIKQYIPLLRLNLLTLVADADNRLVGVGLALPSLSKALQKSRGKLFPFGIFGLLKALKAKRVKVCDLMLVAVHPDYQNKGVNAMIFAKTIAELQKLGVEYVESNPELDLNDKMRGQWEGFDYVQHKRRIAFIKEI